VSRHLSARQVRQVQILPTSPINMTPQEYILEKLGDLKTAGMPAKFESEKDLVDFIFKTVMSKKFRKYSVTPEYHEHIKSAIETNVKNKEPIKFCFTFGAYKLWRLEETPETDWAELFTLIYYANWLKPVAEIYNPGVWFDFFTDDAIVESINNIPKQETEKYHRSLEEVIKFIQRFILPNLKFTINRVGDQYASMQDFKSDLDDKVKKMASELPNGLPILKEKDKQTIEMNVKLKPGQDRDPFWREKVKLLHDAYFLITKKRPYYRRPDKITVGTNPFPGSITVGTTKTSIAKFWVGVGALKKEKEKFMEYVLSPSQLEKTKFEWEKISIEGLTGKNFNRIRIID